jgi:hypothetical protein
MFQLFQSYVVASCFMLQFASVLFERIMLFGRGRCGQGGAGACSSHAWGGAKVDATGYKASWGARHVEGLARGGSKELSH